jgi:Na+:H+ antiporter, NhaA family
VGGRTLAGLAARVSGALRADALGGCLLIGAAILALAWANSPLAPAYDSLRTLTVGPALLHLHLQLQSWAADGLLAVFFFIVGNELKRELVHGELRDVRHAVLPVVAALGGVLMPALLFIVLNPPGSGTAGGWGIPMATDIAFAVAVLALAGRRLPGQLRTFLLTLATVDDLCAVLVIAVFYASGLAWAPLGGAVLGLALFAYLQYGRGGLARWVARRPGWLVYGPLAGVIWALMHASGVHATMAGVAMGLLMRTTERDGEQASPSRRAENLLVPVSAGIALPVFALLSAGVGLTGVSGFWSSPITWGIAGGLIGGKMAGIFGAAWATARFTGARLHPRLGWGDILGVAALGGIGFTVSLLIAELSYTAPARLTNAKAAILLASVIASILAVVILNSRTRHRRNRQRLRLTSPARPRRTSSVTPRNPRQPLRSGGMAYLFFDGTERAELADLLGELGPGAPTLLAPWTTRDLAAHLVLRERDYLAGPGLVLPGAWGRLAERRRRSLALKDFNWLVATFRSGPPPGLFRIGWVRRLASLNEFFVHHEDVRRANGRDPRTNGQALDEALWRNVSRAPWFLARRLRDAGLELQWAGTPKTIRARRGEPTARIAGPPGELLLYLFGRKDAAQVEVSGSAAALEAVRRARFGM